MSQGSASVRVAVVDDHAMVRQSLCSVLEDEVGFEIVAQGGNRHEAVKIARDLRPDVLVLDYHMPGGGALDVLETIEREQLGVKVLVLTVHENVHYAIRALEAGAQGFLIKASAVEELLEAIRQVHRGGVYLTPSHSQGVLDHMRRPRRDRTGLGALSAREFELLRLLGEGLALKEAAHSLRISVSTASTYRTRLLKKLGLDSTSDLIRFALEHGLVGG